MGESKRRKKLDPTFGKSKLDVKAAFFHDDEVITYPHETAGILIGDPHPFMNTFNAGLIGLERLGYEEKGRGILVIPGVRLLLSSLFLYVEMFYLTADEINYLPCLGQTGKTECLRVIASYEPDREGAACFVFADEYEIIRSGGCSPTNSLALLKQQLPDLSEKTSIVFEDDNDHFVFTRGVPADWDERMLPITRRTTFK